MRRGSTPTFTFTLPLCPDSIADASVSIVQDGAEVISVGRSEMTFDRHRASFSLSSAQTMSLKVGKAELQMTVTDILGSVLVSDVRTVAVRKKLPEDA